MSCLKSSMSPRDQHLILRSVLHHPHGRVCLLKIYYLGLCVLCRRVWASTSPCPDLTTRLSTYLYSLLTSADMKDSQPAKEWHSYKLMPCKPFACADRIPGSFQRSFQGWEMLDSSVVEYLPRVQDGPGSITRSSRARACKLDRHVYRKENHHFLNMQSRLEFQRTLCFICTIILYHRLCCFIEVSWVFEALLKQ